MGWLLGGICTWTCRLFIGYQILSTYYAFEYVNDIPFREDVKSKFQMTLHIWIWLSIAFSLSTFIGVKNFCQPEESQRESREEGGIYYDFLDIGSRYAFLLCPWMYYFVVTITWAHHGQVRDVPHGDIDLIVFLGFAIILLLAYVNEINIKILQLILATAHFVICFQVGNYWGVVVSIVMLFNSPFILTCSDPAPVIFNPTFIFTALTLLSSLFMTYFFRTMKETTGVVIRFDDLLIF